MELSDEMFHSSSPMAELSAKKEMLVTVFKTLSFDQIMTPFGVCKNCRSGRYFTSPWRGIGISFQLAIIAPRVYLIGYDIATAQS